jgi:uncharacterized protein (TIGR03086 family)
MISTHPSYWESCVTTALLQEVSDEFASYLSEVSDGDLTAGTPCQGWSVDDLYRHMVELNINLSRAFEVQPSPRSSPDGCVLRETAYRDVARHAADALAIGTDTAPRGRALAALGARSQSDAFALHLTNTLIHTWDLASAIEIEFDPPRQDVLDITLNCLRRLPPHERGDGAAFATIPNFPTGSSMDEILLLSGRNPAWRARRD